MTTFVGASLQYLALLLAAAAAWVEFRSSSNALSGHAGIVWFILAVLFAIGTAIRIAAGRQRPVTRRSLVPPRPTTTSHAADAQDAVSDASRAITPAMLNELMKSRPWVGGFSIILGIAGGLAILVGCFAVIVTEISGGGRTAIGIGLGGGLAQILGGTLILMLFSYVRQHYRAIPAVPGRLSEVQFAAIVDSQRRVVRFFGTMLLVFAALLVLALAAGVMIGIMR